MTHPTDDSLKPCPFCGAGTTEITPNGRMWTGMKYSEPSSVSVRHWCEAVPGQPSRMIERVGRDEASAIDAWNTRALLAEQARTEPTQEFESAQGRALASAWAEGWAQCRDAEYVGEEAESEAFNQSATLAQCLYADQTRFQGGLSNDQLRRAWSAKLPNVIPTDEQLTAFALGIEAAAQPLKAEQAKDAAEDAELLDWIFRQGDEFSYYVIQDAPGDGEYVVHGMGCSGQGKTPRAAIRAARAAERKA